MLLRVALVLTILHAIKASPIVNCSEEVVVLSVEPYTWHIDGQLSFTTRAYFYKGQPMIPGPTIVAQPGMVCSITVLNALPTSSPFATCQTMSNAFQCPDTTNLHTHGLHVSPEEDDPAISIRPGESHKYTLHIPAEHQPGTFWYHSHYHGASTLQVMGGLYGALLVEPAASSPLPDDIAKLYAQDNDQILVLSHVSFGGNDTTGDLEFDMLDYSSASLQTGQDRSLPPNPQFVAGGARDFYVVNGQYQPVINVTADSVAMLRFVHAGVLRIAEVELVDPQSTCELRLIARDGVFQDLPYQRLSSIVLIPGTRSDVAVKCSTPGDLTVRIYPNPKHDPVLGWGNRFSQPLLFTLGVQPAGGSTRPTDFPTSAVPRPGYLSNLLRSPVWVGPKKIQGIHMDVDKKGVNMINNVPFPGHHAEQDMRYLDELCLGLTYEFTVSPPDLELHFRSAHPYHQHVNHFQISDCNGLNMTAAEDMIRLGEWRDTAPAFPPFGIKIRTRPALFEGDGMLHCHLQQHSDKGMAALFKISSDRQCYDSAQQLSRAHATSSTSFFAVLVSAFLVVCLILS